MMRSDHQVLALFTLSRRTNMPFKIGNKAVTGMYKGTQPIGKAFKGTTPIFSSNNEIARFFFSHVPASGTDGQLSVAEFKNNSFADLSFPLTDEFNGRIFDNILSCTKPVGDIMYVVRHSGAMKAFAKLDVRTLEWVYLGPNMTSWPNHFHVGGENDGKLITMEQTGFSSYRLRERAMSDFELITSTGTISTSFYDPHYVSEDRIYFPGINSNLNPDRAIRVFDFNMNLIGSSPYEWSQCNVLERDGYIYYINSGNGGMIKRINKSNLSGPITSPKTDYHRFCIDGEFIYAIDGDGNLFKLNRGDFSIIESFNKPSEWEPLRSSWGTNIFLNETHVFIIYRWHDLGVAAISKATGEYQKIVLVGSGQVMGNAYVGSSTLPSML